MFDVGFWELALIGAVALLIVGPERLPGVARKVGLWVGKARRMLRDVKDDISRELREQEIADLDALKKDVAEVGSKISEAVDIKDTTESLRETLQQAAPSFAETPSPVPNQSKPASKKRAEKTTAKKSTKKKSASKKPATRKKTGDGSYYIYESWYRNREYTTIHKGTCEFCLHGHGRGAGSDPRYTKWHGPFGSMKEARHEQAKITGKKHRECEPCANRIEPRP